MPKRTCAFHECISCADSDSADVTYLDAVVSTDMECGGRIDIRDDDVVPCIVSVCSEQYYFNEDEECILCERLMIGEWVHHETGQACRLCIPLEDIIKPLTHKYTKEALMKVLLDGSETYSDSEIKSSIDAVWSNVEAHNAKKEMRKRKREGRIDMYNKRVIVTHIPALDAPYAVDDRILRTIRIRCGKAPKPCSATDFLKWISAHE